MSESTQPPCVLPGAGTSRAEDRPGRPAAVPAEPSESLQGIIERITFRSEDTGYSVMRLLQGHQGKTITAVGNIGPVSAGETVLLTGHWERHPSYGPQFHFHHYEHRRPNTSESVQKYLASGVISGIGPEMARRLVQKFGAETLLVIEFQPGRLREVAGIGEKRIEAIRAGLAQHRAVQDIAIFLQQCGVSPAFAERLFRQYGDRTLEAIQEDPYSLITQIRGIGFRTADQIGTTLGIPKNARSRIAAGLVYTLSQAADDGHTYLPIPQVHGRASRILEVPMDYLAPVLPELFEKESLVVEHDSGEQHVPGEQHDSGEQPDRVYLPALYRAEMGFARRLLFLLSSPGRKPLPADRVLEWLDRRRGPNEVELSPEQKEALAAAMNQRVCIVTGGPGTGKSTIMRALVRAFETAGRSVLLASPTGRAARRLSEVTGRSAATLHKLLEFDPERRTFRRDQQCPLDGDLVVVDEASMLDILLANSLVKAIAPGTHLVLIGDIDQLPSVGPGNVLRDVIESGVVPVSRLTHVFRQALGSLTVRNAHRVNAGEMPELIHPSRREGADCVFLEAIQPEEAARLTCQLLRISLPRLGFPPDQAQVLVPMNKGPLGVVALNEAVQSVLNPPGPERPEVTRSGVVFRLGDRVQQLVNDYDRDVFNGDVGQVVGIDLDSSVLKVAFPLLPSEIQKGSQRSSIPGLRQPAEPARLAAERRASYRTRDRTRAGSPAANSSPAITLTAGSSTETLPTRVVEYRFADLDELQLAYAMTVHKAQGSEFPAVILLMHEAHAPMLQRNLLYTGLTRGRRMTVLLGSRQAVSQAVARQNQRARLTSLTRRLQENGRDLEG